MGGWVETALMIACTYGKVEADEREASESGLWLLVTTA